MMDWFQGTPRTRDTRITPVRREWHCPQDGCPGFMEYTGSYWPTGDPGYHHRCTVCGHVAAIHTHKFPEIVYV